MIYNKILFTFDLHLIYSNAGLFVEIDSNGSLIVFFDRSILPELEAHLAEWDEFSKTTRYHS